MSIEHDHRAGGYRPHALVDCELGRRIGGRDHFSQKANVVAIALCKRLRAITEGEHSARLPEIELADR